MAKPPMFADVAWTGGLRFEAVSNKQSMVIDGDSQAGPSPVQTLAFALASCMATDVVSILTKGRHPLRALRTHFHGQRAQQDPHRFVSIELAFTVGGEIPEDAIARAIALSRDKYCSVWHSMRQDIDFVVTWTRE